MQRIDTYYARRAQVLTRRDTSVAEYSEAQSQRIVRSMGDFIQIMNDWLLSVILCQHRRGRLACNKRSLNVLNFFVFFFLRERTARILLDF